jgi:hypothetical protein
MGIEQYLASMRPSPDFNGIYDAVQDDLDDLKKYSNRAGGGNAVLPWAFPKQLWESYAFQDMVAAFLLLLRVALDVPLSWKTSLVAPVPKFNDKPGCAAFRPIRLLGPISKWWHSLCWGQASLQFLHNDFGFVLGRRREEAILLIRLARWRLLRRNLGCLLVLYDMTNAFAFVAHSLLSDTVHRVLTGSAAWFNLQ